MSGALAVAVIERGDVRGAVATGVGLLAGAAAYAAIFTWAGLATRHALVIGLVYVFVWEAALAAYLDGIRFLSVRRFTLALVHGLDHVRLATVDISLSARPAAVGTAIVLVGFTALAMRKLSGWTSPEPRAVVRRPSGRTSRQRSTTTNATATAAAATYTTRAASLTSVRKTLSAGARRGGDRRADQQAGEQDRRRRSAA